MLSHPNQVAEDALIALTTRWYLPKLLQSLSLRKCSVSIEAWEIRQ